MRGTPGRPTSHRLELHLDADPFWLSSLRAITTDLAIRADFDLDSVDDLTLAVDEACAAMVGIAAPQRTLMCSFTVCAGQITVTVTLPDGWRPGGPYLRTDSLGWRILTTLADEVQLVRGRLPNGERAAGIRLVKNRAVAEPAVRAPAP